MPLANERLALVVGDASGKGVAAALMIASVQSSLRTAALFTGENLATLLKIVNLQAYASSLADRYATVFYGVLGQGDAHATIRECRTHSADCSSA
jgi:sigma-B regulation protein RsbU (phosphoserine phosphatase)